MADGSRSTGRIVPFGLRIPPETKGQLEQAARKSGRSLNAEIIARLEKTLLDEDDVARTLGEHGERIDQLDDWIGSSDDRIRRLEARLDELGMIIRDFVGAPLEGEPTGLKDRLSKARDDYFDMQMEVVEGLGPEEQAVVVEELYEEMRRKLKDWTPPGGQE